VACGSALPMQNKRQLRAALFPRPGDRGRISGDFAVKGHSQRGDFKAQIILLANGGRSLQSINALFRAVELGTKRTRFLSAQMQNDSQLHFASLQDTVPLPFDPKPYSSGSRS